MNAGLLALLGLGALWLFRGSGGPVTSRNLPGDGGMIGLPPGVPEPGEAGSIDLGGWSLPGYPTLSPDALRPSFEGTPIGVQIATTTLSVIPKLSGLLAGEGLAALAPTGMFAAGGGGAAASGGGAAAGAAAGAATVPLAMVAGWAGLVISFPFIMGWLAQTFDIGGHQARLKRRIENASLAADTFNQAIDILRTVSDGRSLAEAMLTPLDPARPQAGRLGELLHHLARRNLAGEYVGRPYYWWPQAEIRFLPAFFRYMEIPETSAFDVKHVDDPEELLAYTGYNLEAVDRATGANLWGSVLTLVAGFVSNLVAPYRLTPATIPADEVLWSRALLGFQGVSMPRVSSEQDIVDLAWALNGFTMRPVYEDGEGAREVLVVEPANWQGIFPGLAALPIQRLVTRWGWPDTRVLDTVARMSLERLTMPASGALYAPQIPVIEDTEIPSLLDAFVAGGRDVMGWAQTTILPLYEARWHRVRDDYLTALNVGSP